MTQQEFLDELGVSRDEFRDIVQRFSYFFEPLNKAQKHAVRHMMPTISESARSFGPDVTPERLKKILAGILEGIEFVILGCYTGEVTLPSTTKPSAPPQPKSKKPTS